VSAAARKRQLLALARSGGSAAVREQGRALWPGSIRIAGNSYVLRGTPAPNVFAPSRVVGHYVWRERGVALTLAEAQRASSSDNSNGLER
jgi:hypothetical protein